VSNVIRKIENQLTDSNQLSKMVSFIRKRLLLKQGKACPFFPMGGTIDTTLLVI
jgi:hypothetical protein